MGKRKAGMSKSKLRGVVGYTCYTRTSLQCTALSTLKPGKVANEQGSFLPTDYIRSQPRAATAPAGAKRTVSRLQSVEIGEDSFLSVHRPNPDQDARDRAKEFGLPRKQDASHWESNHRGTFQGEFGEPASPQSGIREDLSPIGSPVEEHKKPETCVLQAARKSAGDQLQLLVKRPQTHHMGMRPRPGSRQGNMTLRGKHKGDVEGTTQGTVGQIPGYTGFIPKSETNQHAHTQANLGADRPDMKDSLFASYRRVLPGYRGFQPQSVHNDRSFETAHGTTYGAGNASMKRYCRSNTLSRPEAGGESLIIKSMFTAPLDGRPSDNGLTNAQTFFSNVRPYEGLPRVHYPNVRHQAGCKFAMTSVSSMKDSGANLRNRLSKAA